VDIVWWPWPASPPALPDIPQDALSPFRAHHDVKSQSQFVLGSTWSSDRERLDGSRNLASKYLLPKLEEDCLCTYRTSSRSDSGRETEALSHSDKLDSPWPEPRIKVGEGTHTVTGRSDQLSW